MARYNSPEDVDNSLRRFNVSRKHMCWGCPYGRPMEDRFSCIFITGSCARYPWTLENPDPELIAAKAKWWLSRADENDIKKHEEDNENGGAGDQSMVAADEDETLPEL